MNMKCCRVPPVSISLAAFFLVPGLSASITNLQITVSVPSPQPLGTVILFQASATGAADYLYSVQGPLDSTFHVVRDYNASGSLQLAPIEHEGVYQIQVTAWNPSTQDTAQLVISYTLTPIATGNQPIVSPTANPLVALYSAPPCPVGSSMFVQFGLPNSSWSSTASKPCANGLTMNFYIAGMYANSTYNMQYSVVTGSAVQTGPISTFTTGTPTISPSSSKVLLGPVQPSASQQPVLLNSPVVSEQQLQAAGLPIATDLAGQLLWYNAANYLPVALARPVAGGTMLMITAINVQDFQTHLLIEEDLAGNPIRETNAWSVSNQLQALGMDPITFFDHDARRLPNGYTVALGTTEKVYNNVQGVKGPVDIMGDTVIVLDENFQVAWAWSIFDHLNINRKATLGEICNNQNTDCSYLYTPVNGQANDWTHSNAIDYSPFDGSLLLSVRNQDWILKINYADGTGDGQIIWKLGLGGDFSMVSSGVYWPWFSHQHDANFVSTGPDVIELYDNGNTRFAYSFYTGHSRGQVLALNTTQMQATLMLNADLGVYSLALGSAEKLLGGTYHFMTGVNDVTVPQSRVWEVTSPSGAAVYSLEVENWAYRTFRMQSLYAE
jgi:arylsulfate sulfotransferase